VLTSAPAGFGITTSELSVDFLRVPTIKSQTITARGRVIHATRSLGLAEATVGDARGRSLGSASSRCVLFRVDSATFNSRHLTETSTESGPATDVPDPYLCAVEGEIYGREYWDTMSGLDVFQEVVGGTFLPPCFCLMGLRGVAISKGEMAMSMPASVWLCNSFGVLYSGAIAYLADAGTAFNTIDLKLYFLRPVMPSNGDLIARANVAHRGRTIAVVNCDITALDGALVAQAISSVLILPGRHWERPVQIAEEITAESAGEPVQDA
jgi:uncharacterized protein (TIGR00369 family)